MKIFKSVLLLAIAVVAFSSCGKDDAAAKGVEGTWEGKWGFDEETPTNYEMWVIEKGGDVTVYDTDGDVDGSGRWSLEGLNFEMEYTPEGSDNTDSYFGLYHDQLNEIIGTWGKKPSHTNGGSFEMYKQ